MIMECTEFNWLCKHMDRGQRRPSSHSCTEMSKTQFFPESIVK